MPLFHGTKLILAKDALEGASTVVSLASTLEAAEFERNGAIGGTCRKEPAYAMK